MNPIERYFYRKATGKELVCVNGTFVGRIFYKIFKRKISDPLVVFINRAVVFLILAIILISHLLGYKISF